MDFTPTIAGDHVPLAPRVIPFNNLRNGMTPVPLTDGFDRCDLSPWERLRFATDCLRSPDAAVSQRAYVWAFQETVFHPHSFDAVCLTLDINSVSFRQALLRRYPNARRHHANRWMPPVGMTA